MNIHETISILKLLPKQGNDVGDTKPKSPGQGAADKAETTFKNTLSDLNKSLGINNRELDKSIQLLDALESATLKTADRFNILEERALGVQKSLKLNTDEAIAFARSLDGLSIQFEVNRTTAKQYIGELQNFIPGTGKLIQGNTRYFKTQVQLNEVLRDRLKLDENSANAFRTLTNLQNGELIPSLKEYGQIATDFAKGEAGFKYQGGFQDFFEEISKLSDDIVAQFSSMGKKELVKTVLEAKRLGLTLNDLQKSGEGFLDIQKQTEASMTFQMFSGKRFETQTNKNIAASMAQATINGDAAKQLEIINDVVATHGKMLKTNFKARKAAADMLGIEESVLAKVLKKQKELARIADNKGEATELSTEDLAMLDQIGLQTTTERVKRGTAQDQANLVKSSDAAFVAGDIVKAANTFKDTLIDFFEDEKIGKLAVDTLFIGSDITFAKELLKGSVAEVTSAAGAVPTGKRRFGGPVAAGTSYVVGEVGPEMFTPSTAGTITPNNQMASSGGGSQAIVDALKEIQFNVINKFDGDAILTSIEMAADNRLT